MTSENDGTYAGQYPCDVWVYNLEPTLCITMPYFLIQGHNLKKSINVIPIRRKVYLLIFRTRNRVNYSYMFEIFVLEIELITCICSEFITDLS